MNKKYIQKIPKFPEMDEVYYVLPSAGQEKFYNGRVNRNLPWITQEEQALLRTSVVAIAGCGGMGGLLASILVRLGVGEIRIADNETFEVSNLNRQYAAFRHTLGRSKALETGRLIRAIAKDTTIVIYPQGITEETAASFVEGAHVICDEIEFWAIGARYVLHQAMRKTDSVLFNAPTVGHRTYITKFTKTSATIEQAIGLSPARANALQAKIISRMAGVDEVRELTEALLPFVAPELPEYSADTTIYSSHRLCLERLLEKNTAPIIATNPPMATGFLANQVLFELLARMGLVKRTFKCVPEMYGYHMFDAAHMITCIYEGDWITPLRKNKSYGTHNNN